MPAPVPKFQLPVFVKGVKGGTAQTIPNSTDTVITFVDEFDPQAVIVNVTAK